MKTKNHCVKCKHDWEQRDEKVKPKSCPKCKTYNWEKAG
jgi:hypothetical protein